MTARGRRLGAIMFTDIVGYTLMASRDEAAALDLLRRYRETLRSVFPRFEGRVVKSMGDGFLVEFASAVEAVNCAVEIQQRMRGLNSSIPGGRRIPVRVGVHVGDVVHSGDDVLGDAVNVASRVEPLAEPGGVCVTRQVLDQVEGKVKWQFLPLGVKELRNVPAPVEVYAVGMEGSEPSPRLGGPLYRRRVAILPFSNLSPDPNDKYFADGITEELISTVSRIGNLSVISRSSAMRYRDTPLPIGQVGRELGVGAILEGSVRKAGNKVRIAAQLIEVDSDRYVWSRTYDRDLVDIFAVQGEIAQQVALGLEVQLLSREKQMLEARQTKSPEAYSLYLKGRYYWNERTEEGVKKAVEYFNRAIKADANFARAYSGLADCYVILANYEWMAPAPAGDLAKENVLKAMAIDGSLAEAHASLGLVHINHDWDFLEAEKELKLAIDLNQSYVPAYHWYSILKLFQSRSGEALALIRRALELDPYSIVIRQAVGVVMLSLRRDDEAKGDLAELAEENPRLPSVHFWLAVANLALYDYPGRLRRR